MAAEAPAEPALTPLERATAFLDNLRSAGTFDDTPLRGLAVVSAAPGRVTCRLRPTRAHSNRFGSMHGGCIATLVDVIGSAAIATVSDRGGVSVAINTNYLSPTPIGEDLDIEATVVKRGKQMATAVVNLSVAGEAVAQGSHVKALVPLSDLSALWAAVAEERRGVAAGSGGLREGQQQQQQQQQQRPLQHSRL
ncbi:hypothetical protein Rsub_11142 [Raphidocelis subcapitata]|uniref:Acyl-coenzyme A thioesterase 13 n=1 Tax=Raphidocelis subcapitata TaxID=307507 RepID=A0A2V0PDV3_9CHLO|nr:hypothetical protein Rsub_11142 [Raphidocelis subcapitata]|eukprot:GBF98031.1 hypothetical protein Rsub_11142 [Raphidocelis subcapitata]